MTQGKKLKKAVRARAAKTGESYSTARRHVLAARARARAARVARSTMVDGSPASLPATAEPRGSAKPRGISDAAVRAKTGFGRDHWFKVLDTFGAGVKGHTASARHLRVDHGIPGWHAQMIAVAYERDRGLRSTNQACTGEFQVSVSRAIAASFDAVVDALSDDEQRKVWLGAANQDLAQALFTALHGPKPRTIRRRDARNASLRFPWGASRIEIRITGGPRGVSVVADNSKLADATEVEARRVAWQVALDSLKSHVSA